MNSDKPIRKVKNQTEIRGRDTVFHNTYNRGAESFEYQGQNKPQADPLIMDLYVETFTDDIVDVRDSNNLQEEFYKHYIGTVYQEKDIEDPSYYREISLKVTKKSELQELYYYFYNKMMKDKKYSDLEFLLGFIKFFDIFPKILWKWSIYPIHKQVIISELSERGFRDVTENSSFELF